MGLNLTSLRCGPRNQDQPPLRPGMAADKPDSQHAETRIPSLARYRNVASDRPFDIDGKRGHGFHIRAQDDCLSKCPRGNPGLTVIFNKTPLWTSFWPRNSAAERGRSETSKNLAQSRSENL